MSDKNIEQELPKDLIVIYSTEDGKIETIGKLLAFEPSRKILVTLLSETLTANYLAEKLNYDLPLVKYHLNKMLDLGIVKIAKIEKSMKAQDMKFYTASQFAVVITSSHVSEKAKNSKMLIRSLKMIYKLSSVGVAGIATWFVTRFVQNVKFVPVNNDGSKPILNLDSKIFDIPPSLDSSSLQFWNKFWMIIHHDVFWSAIFTVIVISSGLFFILHQKKKKFFQHSLKQ
jgi:predicted transcriptional regulator